MPRFTYQRRARFWSSLISTVVQLIAVGLVGLWVVPAVGVSISWYFVVVVIVVLAAWDVFTYVAGTRAMDRMPVSGKETMLKRLATVASPLRPEGMVRLDGELWPSRSLDGDIESGEVEIVAVDQLKLVVRRADKEHGAGTQGGMG